MLNILQTRKLAEAIARSVDFTSERERMVQRL